MKIQGSKEYRQKQENRTKLLRKIKELWIYALWIKKEEEMTISGSTPLPIF